MRSYHKDGHSNMTSRQRNLPKLQTAWLVELLTVTDSQMCLNFDMLLVNEPQSRFLKTWYESNRNYNASQNVKKSP